VEAELSKKLGRPAVVRTIAWGGAGYDALYFISKELLRHRKVHTLVYYDENPTGNQRNVQSPTWFRWSDDSAELNGLPLPEKGRFYLSSVLAVPKMLLGKVRSNLPADMSPQIVHVQEAILHAPNPDTQCGSFPSVVGFNSSLDSWDFTPFVPYAPDTGSLPDQTEIYSASNAGSYRFSGEHIPEWQGAFARKFASLASANSAQLVMLHIPVLAEAKEGVVSERTVWPEYLNAPVAMVGIAPAKLFSNIEDGELLKLYADRSHFNRNGMNFFTRVMTPSLLKLYDAKAKN
jgi:hypothetical protein